MAVIATADMKVPIRKACTSAPIRTVTRHMDEDARQIARDIFGTDPFDLSRRKRKKVEMLFAHLKRNLRFTRSAYGVCGAPVTNFSSPRL